MEATHMSMPFNDFEDALKHLPKFISGIDLVGQHKTIGDLAFRVQHEIDLAVEGEPNEITQDAKGHPLRATDCTKHWGKCRTFLRRCAVSTRAPETACKDDGAPR